MNRNGLGPATAMRIVAVTAPPNVPVVLAGDHVRVWRGLYWHHAVYVGDGWLIEFGSSIFGGRVAHVEWGVFSKGRSVDWVSRGGREAVQRAFSQLGRSDFDVLSRNCEHFATWCVTGRWESGQVELVGWSAFIAAMLLVANKKAA